MTEKKIKYTFQAIHFGTKREEQNPKSEINSNFFLINVKFCLKKFSEKFV